MFRRKSSPQESSARLWWAVAYLAGVLVYVSIEWVYFGATFWTALIGGAFWMVFPVAGLAISRPAGGGPALSKAQRWGAWAVVIVVGVAAD
jgi:hypothetical protein